MDLGIHGEAVVLGVVLGLERPRLKGVLGVGLCVSGVELVACLSTLQTKG